MSEAIYLGRDGQRLGPYTRAQLGAMAASGGIGAADVAWQEGMAEWQPAATVLAALGIKTASAPPPLPDAAGVAIPAPAPASAAPLTQSALYEAFLGPDNCRYYLPLFERFDGGGSALSWNWAAIFITQLWMLYRGMLLWGFLFYPMLSWLALIVLSVVASALRGSAAQGVIYLAYLAVYFVLPGLYGNKLFHSHVRRMIERSGTLGLSDQLRREWLIRKGGGNIVFVVLLVPVVIAIIGILAAIAIPAYQDYVIRSQVAEGAMLADQVKTGVTDYYASQHAYPTDNQRAGLAPPAQIGGHFVQSVEVADGTVRVLYGAGVNPRIAGKVLAYVPEDAGTGGLRWSCKTAATTLPNKFRPAVCRE